MEENKEAEAEVTSKPQALEINAAERLSSGEEIK